MQKHILIYFLSIFGLCNAQWPKVDAYRAYSSVAILHDMEALYQEGNVYKALPYIEDIAALVKKDVIPYRAKFQYDSYGEKKSFKEFVPDLIVTFNALEDLRKARALTALVFFSGLSEYIQPSKELVEKNEGRGYYLNEILDEQTTIIAAAGYYDLAKKQLNGFSNLVSGERALMHLAVLKALKGEFNLAEEYAKKSISKIKNNDPDYETIRQFFKLTNILGQNNKKEIAMKLINTFPEDTHKISAKAYFYSGNQNEKMLQSLISEARKLKSLNYPLREIGYLGAKMKSAVVANAAISAMNLRYNRQYPVYIMTELAKTTKNKSALSRAISYSYSIPSSATIAKADAEIWIAIATLKLAESENEALKALARIQNLSPEYRIKFHLRWKGYTSQRFYTGYN